MVEGVWMNQIMGCGWLWSLCGWRGYGWSQGCNYVEGMGG